MRPAPELLRSQIHILSKLLEGLFELAGVYDLATCREGTGPDAAMLSPRVDRRHPARNMLVWTSKKVPPQEDTRGANCSKR